MTTIDGGDMGESVQWRSQSTVGVRVRVPKSQRPAPHSWIDWGWGGGRGWSWSQVKPGGAF